MSHIGKANSLDGLTGIYRTEGMRGLYKGSLLALVGVSNGSIQFATYEDLKRRRTEAKRRKFQKSEKEFRIQDEKLVCSLLVVLGYHARHIADRPVKSRIHLDVWRVQDCSYSSDVPIPGGASKNTSETSYLHTLPISDPSRTPHRLHPNLALPYRPSSPLHTAMKASSPSTRV